MMMKNVLKKLFQIASVCIMIAVLFSSCSKDELEGDWSEEVTVYVSSETGVFTDGNGDQSESMTIKVENTDDGWYPAPFYFISGFTYEEGYAYTLKVEVTHLANPPMDDFSARYKLIEIISKELKE